MDKRKVNSKGLIRGHGRYRTIVLSLACIVVFVTTYMLILPALTLEKDKAAEQGGIDVPSAVVEETESETAESPDEDTGKDIKDIEEESDIDAEDTGQDTKDTGNEQKDELEASAKGKKPEELTFEGEDYTVTVADKNFILPESVHVESEEIRREDSKQKEAYDDYVAKTEEALGWEEGTVSYARIFDIKIVDSDGNKFDIPEPVDVSIRLDDRDSSEVSERTKNEEPASAENLQVVHFADGADEGEKIESVTENKDEWSEVEFQADSFSVYSIVEAPEPVHFDPYKIVSLEELEENTGYLLSYGSPEKYFTAEMNIPSLGSLKESTNSSAAADWCFEKAGEEDGTFYIYTLADGVKKYIRQTAPEANTIELADSGTAFVLSEAADKPGTFIIKHSSEKLYLQHSNGGKGIRFYSDANNANNSRIFITNNSSASYTGDPYDLNGKTFGIAYNDDSTSAAAMMADSKPGNKLAGLDLLIRNDVLTNKGNLLVAENSEIQEWTFEYVEKDRYYIKTTVDGEDKYLHIRNNNVTLVDDQASASVIQATPGTGSNSGKWHFTVNNYSLNFTGGNAKDFNAVNNSNATTWLNLVEKSTLSDDDFVEYSARKISVSDDILGADAEEKAKIIVYTRVWNETAKKYEYYALDHDGSLVRVYDSGDKINWIGNKVNSALWEFTEYTNDDGTPNYFYELENTAYTGTYLAPQSDSIIADQPVGINLNGRRDGFDYTSIVAWDDDAYAYSGLKIERNEDGSLRAVACALDEADDFHFAIITPPVAAADPTTTVPTVDNNDYGISIKMTDFNNNITGGRDEVQTSYLGSRTWDAAHAYEAETGLVSTNLTGGYPTVTAHTPKEGESLAGLFSNMQPANHLFIQSTYNESGYFEYDSTQNFAHLNDNGIFTVYDQIGAIGTSTGPTRTHGQFMPYNDISSVTGYAHDNQGNVITNKTDIRGQEISDADPRKGEPLYSIPQNQADYYFGMELSAVFTQTPNGEDNWGHDIIFEFTGDDDFWFYVDGELVLDLGGVHSALGGSVNFKTGEVISNGTKTTLYDIFKSNYRARGKNVDDVDKLFTTKIVNGETVHVFDDYTTHEMKMFYMERGAGASNLKMRFNLASVKPGTVELSKKLKGIDNKTNKLIQYPYQIWYQTVEYKQNQDGTYVLDENGDRVVDHYNDAVLLSQPKTNNNLTGKVYAVYKGTKTLIPYKDSMTIGGESYNNVFLLKADETAVINFPENTYRYKIVECGIDTEVYDHVYINGDKSENEIFGKPYNNTDGCNPEDGEETQPDSTTTYEGSTRSDFGMGFDTTEGRPRVEYTNEVTPDVMRTVSFKKVLYDAEGKRLTDEQAAQVPASFNFRLFLGNELADHENLLPADMYSYYIKGPDNNYCKWDKANKKFVSLGVSTFEGFKGLSDADQRAGTFTTSMYGSISKIPAGYTVEVRDLVVGTGYKIEEPDRDLPRGYTRRDSDGYVRTDLAGGDVVYYTENGTYSRHPEKGNKITAEPISDTIADKTESPEIEIRNQEGWGLTAKKEWTDKDFIIHDPIYLAIYLDDGTGNPGDLVEGTVRRLNTNETEVYWFIPDLKINGVPHTFNEYIVREVELTGDFTVDKNTGAVTGYTDIIPVAKGDPITVGGRTFSGVVRPETTYTVDYKTGDSTGQNHNIRTDTIINTRPGIQIYKTDWAGETYLSGAVFTLKDAAGHDVGHASYTSGSNGLVTTAYLDEGTFTLDEIRTPFGYAALDEPVTITVTTAEPVSYDLIVPAGNTNYYIKLSGPEGFYTTAAATETDMARITIKNRSVQDLKIVKEGVDGDARTRLSNVHFALYDQVKDSDGNVRPAYTPKAGYDDIVTDENGVLTGVTMNIGPGTYYLREKAAPSGYKKLPEDLCFTIGKNGTVVINNDGYSNWITRDTTVPGSVSYQISVENTPLGITIRKTDELEKLLTGSKFTLSRKNDAGSFVAVDEYDLGEDGLIDLTDRAEITFTGMTNGIYMLSETVAPSGYIILTKDIYFSVSDGAVTLTDEDGKEETYSDIKLSDNNTTIAVKNTAGASLPNSGGIGTTLFYILGSILAAGCAVVLIAHRRIIRS